MRAQVVGKGHFVGEIVEQTYLEASAGSAVAVIAGTAEDTAAALDAVVSGVVDSAGVVVMAVAVHIFE